MEGETLWGCRPKEFGSGRSSGSSSRSADAETGNTRLAASSVASLRTGSAFWRPRLELEVVLLEKCEVMRALTSVGVDEVRVGAEDAELVDERVENDWRWG